MNLKLNKNVIMLNLFQDLSRKIKHKILKQVQHDNVGVQDDNSRYFRITI
jgi:hypothetical protein